jgi:hypothetical protein
VSCTARAVCTFHGSGTSSRTVKVCCRGSEVNRAAGCASALVALSAAAEPAQHA